MSGRWGGDAKSHATDSRRSLNTHPDKLEPDSINRTQHLLLFVFVPAAVLARYTMVKVYLLRYYNIICRGVLFKASVYSQ